MRFQTLKQLSKARISDAQGGITIVRLGVALIILMHPLHGFFHPQNIPLFGEFLSSLNYPMGEQLAWAVLILQTLCSIGLILNYFVLLACLGHCIVILFGILHFHAQFGWYVVGPGQGGIEWGAILLIALGAIAWSYWPRPTSTTLP